VNIATMDPDESPTPLAQQTRLLRRTRLTLFQVACPPRRDWVRPGRMFFRSQHGVDKAISGLRPVGPSCSGGGSVLS
jgi:hypothetical protein